MDNTHNRSLAVFKEPQKDVDTSDLWGKEFADVISAVSESEIAAIEEKH